MSSFHLQTADTDFVGYRKLRGFSGGDRHVPNGLTTSLPERRRFHLPGQNWLTPYFNFGRRLTSSYLTLII